MTENPNFDAMMDKMAAMAVEAQEEPAENKDAQDDAAEYTVCPCCGKRTLPKQHQVDPVLLDQFLACVITGETFLHEYSLYDGKIKLTVVRLKDDDRTMLRSLHRWFEAGVGMPEAEARGITLDSLKNPETAAPVLRMIREITVQNNGKVYHFYPAERVAEAYDVLKDVSSSIVNEKWTADVEDALKHAAELLTHPTYISGIHPLVFTSTTTLHDRIFDMLVESGFDASFWAGIKFA